MTPDKALVGVSTDARMGALADLLNPFAFASTMHHMRDVDLRLVLDMDGVHLILGDTIGQQVYVRLTKDTKDWLRARGLSAVSNERKQECRVLLLISTHSAAAEVTHCACVIRDDSFAGKKLEAYAISPSMSVWFYPNDYDVARFFDRYVCKFIFARIASIPDEIYTAHDLDVTAVPVLLSSPDATGDDDAAPDEVAENEAEDEDDDEDDAFELLDEENNEEEEEEVDKDMGAAAAAAGAAPIKLREAFLTDGDHPQVKAALDEKFVDACRRENVDIFKLCASCSLTQVPGDLGPCHSSLHRFFQRHRPSQQRRHAVTCSESFSQGGVCQDQNNMIIIFLVVVLIFYACFLIVSVCGFPVVFVCALTGKSLTLSLLS